MSMAASIDSSHLPHLLAGQPHHQIEADVVEARGPARLPARGGRGRRRGYATAGLQLVVAKRLHAETESVDASLAKPSKHRHVHRFGVGLERDLRIFSDVDTRGGRRR